MKTVSEGSTLGYMRRVELCKQGELRWPWLTLYCLVYPGSVHNFLASLTSSVFSQAVRANGKCKLSFQWLSVLSANSVLMAEGRLSQLLASSTFFVCDNGLTIIRVKVVAASIYTYNAHTTSSLLDVANELHVISEG